MIPCPFEQPVIFRNKGPFTVRFVPHDKTSVTAFPGRTSVSVTVRIHLPSVHTAAFNLGFSFVVFLPGLVPPVLPSVVFAYATECLHLVIIKAKESAVTKRKNVLLKCLFLIGRKYHSSYI